MMEWRGVSEIAASAWTALRRWRGTGYLLAGLGGACLTLLLSSRGTPRDPSVGGPGQPREARSSLESTLREIHPWNEPPQPSFAIPPYAADLAGVKIVLDPGHGGCADRKGWKIGPTGLREAEVNLRVAMFLAEFLEAAGAEVTMTRDADVNLHPEDDEDLRLRAEVANQLQADLLLSIHHNAFHDPSVNYSLVFYHGEPEERPASVAAAEHLLLGLHDAMRLDRTVGAGVRSDYAIYPRRGFAVLRHARVPAVLTESSFYTDPLEEQRLRDPLYNRREAYGMFLGLARWAHAGLPRVALARVTPNAPSDGAILLQLDDGLSRRAGAGAGPKLFRDSLRVRINGGDADFDFDPGKLQVFVRPPGGASRVDLEVQFRNVMRQPVLHPRMSLSRGHDGEWRPVR